MNNILHSLHFISPLAPELYLALAACALLMIGVFCAPRATGGMITLAVIFLAVTLLLLCFSPSAHTTAMNHMAAVNGFTQLSKVIVVLAALLTLINASQWLSEKGGKPFEFLALILFSTLGMMVMISANDLLVLYVGLELMSLALYVLASFERDTTKTTEAGLKYFVLGALASGMLLFGASLIYGFTGTTNFTALHTLLAEQKTLSPALTLGIVLLMIGLCFKISAAPFHMWTPDVYEGAPTPVTAFFSTAPKVAALAIFLRILIEALGSASKELQPILISIAVLTMLVGAFGALRQTNIKRLLAYSSIGHVGFMLIGFAAGGSEGVQSVLIYATLYIFMSAGAFACVLMMQRHGEYVETIESLSGISHKRPVLALALSAMMFSMAGIPPFAGFFGKFYVVLAAINANLIGLAVIGVLISVISCYYYLKVVKVMYFDPPADAFDAPAHPMLKLGLFISTAVTVGFFLSPSFLTESAKAAAAMLVQS